jgi:hypothetical protein
MWQNALFFFPKPAGRQFSFGKDNVNLCKPAYLIIGGNMNASTISNYDGVIARMFGIQKLVFIQE